MQTIFKKGRKVKLNSHNYVIEELLGQGGSGEVYKISEEGHFFALKVFFPYYQLTFFGLTEVSGKVSELVALQKKEYEFLSNLSHPNIVRVHDIGTIKLHATEQKRVQVKSISELPVLITELVDGLPISKAIKDFSLDASQISHLLRRFALALQYLHLDCEYMHTDIKSANILVRKIDLEPILIDFALCKNLNFSQVDSKEHTKLLGDWDLFPKDLSTDHQLKTIKETEGKRCDIRDLAFPTLDLFQVGKLLKSLLPNCLAIFNEREMEYLQEISAQLTDWELASQWGSDDLVERINRIAPEHFCVFGVPELTSPSTTDRTITIPPGVGVPITKRIEQIIETRSFRRLSLINQLGLISVIYPGADYKRSVHVLYSYDIARQLVTQLYSAPLFRSLFDRRGAQQLLITVLLHDINHFPFLHIFQESGIPSLDKIRILDLFCNGEATGERAAGKPAIYDLLSDVGIDPDRFKLLLFGEHHEQKSEIDHIINSMINSGVDADKLSYLFLDGYFSGVLYGTGIDYPCIMKAATVGRLDQNRAPHLAFTDRALQALENVVMTRFWNFRSLYWHHTNRAIMAMMLRVVRKLYITHNRDVQDYILGTRWLNDFGALRYIEEQHIKQFDRPSILSGIIEDRSRLFRRLYSVHAGLEDNSDDYIYRECRKLNLTQEMDLCKRIGISLSEFLPKKGGKQIKIDEDEVLLDIPRREDMDAGGAVFILTSTGTLMPLDSFSDPVRSISSNYEQLTKRIRFFISPRLSQLLGKKRRNSERKNIQSLIMEALKKTIGKKQAR